jgi:hypothetical protein
MTMQASHIERYRGGECERVWAELQALGAGVREGTFYIDALAVAQEMMRRVRHNLELLTTRLQSIGYDFSYEWARADVRMMGIEDPDVAPYLPPEFRQREPVIRVAPRDADVALQLAELETLRGHVPISVMAWYQVVGSVNFTGLAPESWWKRGAAPSGVYRRKLQSHTDRVDKERELHDERVLERRKNTCWLDPICVWPIDQAIESMTPCCPASSTTRSPRGGTGTFQPSRWDLTCTPSSTIAVAGRPAYEHRNRLWMGCSRTITYRCHLWTTYARVAGTRDCRGCMTCRDGYTSEGCLRESNTLSKISAISPKDSFRSKRPGTVSSCS